MAKQCFLHIGAPKTGSTSIQQSLNENKTLLKSKGYFLPSFEKNHRFLVSCFHDDPASFDYNRYNDYNSELIAANNSANLHLLETEFHSSECSSLLLSSEHLVLLSKSGINRLKNYLLGLVDSITVILYLRHLDSVGSFIQESVKNGDRCIDNLIESPPYTRSKYLLLKWSSIFGKNNIIVRDVQASSLINSDLIDDFLASIRYPTSERNISKLAANQSLSQLAVEIADRLAILYPKHSKERAPQRHITSLLSQIKGPKYRPSASVLESVRRSSIEDLDYLKNEWSLDLVRSSSIVDETEPWTPLQKCTLEALAMIVNTAAKQLGNQTPNSSSQ